MTTSSTGYIFVPKTPEVYDDPGTHAVNEGYDLDGNTLTDGRWTYTWDAENHLITLVGHTGLSTVLRLEYEYDHQGRRIRKRVWNNTAGTGAPTLERKYLYDGWNLLAELDGGNAVQRSYVWGLDLSGSRQGAGGVGGLILARNHVSPAGYHFACYDGNGNVTALVDASTGNYSAHYEYDPFGQPLRATGAMAKLNPYRFSTKYTDDETDLLYYGYRYYNPSTGRWLNKDPFEEKGEIAFYVALSNQMPNDVDLHGLVIWS